MGHKPQREQNGQRQAAGRRLEQQQDAGQQAQNPRHQRGHRAKARPALHFKVKDQVHNTCAHGQDAVKQAHAGQPLPGVGQDVDPG